MTPAAARKGATGSTITRREFTAALLSGLPAISTASSLRVSNRSFIGGVQFGLQPFCYHDLPMTPENRGTLLERLVQNGFGMVELHATWVEPRFTRPGASAADARAELRAWRLSKPVDHYRRVRKEFEDGGVDIFTYYVNIDDSYTDAEIDAVFDGAKALGARGCVGSQGLKMSQRLARFPHAHGMFVGIHNHANLSDPDAFASEASFEKGLSFSPDVLATLDTRHYTAANGDCVAFLRKHHDRISGVHLGDRRRNNGRSTPFGEGDAPIIEVLRMIRDNAWPIVALLEFEHGTLRPQVREVQLMFDYCKRAVLS
jgi:xylose isomerase-like TIM barrel protein